MLSEIVWTVIIGCAVVWELVGVFFERQTHVEPLTELTRDRLFKRYLLLRTGWWLFLAWVVFHYFVQ